MNSERCSVALLSMIMMLLLSLLGAALLMLSKTDLQIATNHRDGIAAQYLAEAGIQCAIAKLRTDPDFVSQSKTSIQIATSESLGTTTTTGSHTVQTGPNSSVTNESTRLITATGVVNQARRQITVNVTLPAEDSPFSSKWSN